MPECSAGVPRIGSRRTPKVLEMARPGAGLAIGSRRTSALTASSVSSAASSSLTLVSNSAWLSSGDQRAAEALLAAIDVQLEPRLLGRLADRVGRLVGVLGQRVDADHLLVLDGPQRLVDGDEELVGVVGRRFRGDRGTRRPEGERLVAGAVDRRRRGQRGLQAVERGAGVGALVRLVGRHRSGLGKRAGLAALQHRPDAAMALGQLRLARQQLAHLALHQLLVEQLAAGDAVDLGAQRGNAVLVGLLHARLAGRRGAEQVVAQHQVAGRQEVADGHRRERRAGQGGDPRADREMPDLVAARDDDRVRLPAPAEGV